MLVGAGLATWALTRDDGPQTYVVTPPPAGAADTPRTRPDGAAAVLDRLVRAIRRGDTAAAAALADPDDPDAVDLLRGLVDTAVAARVTDLSLRYIEDSGPLGADRTWSGDVAVRWRYAGFDEAAARTEVAVRFALPPDQPEPASPATSSDTATQGVTIAGIGGPELRTPVWMAGPALVDRTATSLVLVSDTGSASLQPYERLARGAVPVVSRVLTQWRPRLVVEVPADETALERALGVDPGYYAQIAAVTGSSDGSTAPGSPVHVYVNRSVFDGLGRAGQRVVLDHEAAHVAGDGPRSQGPTWLIEGFADYVALRDTRLPLARTAAQIAAQVRADGAPAALPAPSDFDTLGPHLGAVYESAWLICVTLAERGGEAALTRFYESVSDGTPVAQALRTGFDWTEADLLAAWQARLMSLPR